MTVFINSNTPALMSRISSPEKLMMILQPGTEEQFAIWASKTTLESRLSPRQPSDQYTCQKQSMKPINGITVGSLEGLETLSLFCETLKIQSDSL